MVRNPNAIRLVWINRIRPGESSGIFGNGQGLNENTAATHADDRYYLAAVADGEVIIATFDHQLQCQELKVLMELDHNTPWNFGNCQATTQSRAPTLQRVK